MNKTIQINDTLEERVQELEQKANRVEQSKNTASEVQQASEDIKRISSRLDEVKNKAKELRFFIRLYEKAFNGSRPETVQQKLRTAQNKIEISNDELLTAAQEERLTDLEDQVKEAKKRVNEATKTMNNMIKSEQEDWLDDLDSASELNRIIGGNSEFQKLISRMREFLNKRMWDPSKSPGQLAKQWVNYQSKWEKNTGRHGWSTFQDEHGLSDDTVEELQQFSSDDPVRLSDLSLNTLEEIKRVSELESALQIEVRSS